MHPEENYSILKKSVLVKPKQVSDKGDGKPSYHREKVNLLKEASLREEKLLFLRKLFLKGFHLVRRK